MKAWVLKEPKPVEENPLAFEEVETPKPAEGELLIKVSACGVCGTDIQTVEGTLPLPTLPIIPGHQVVGKVAELGGGLDEGASGFKVGDLVGVSWLYWACGKCRYCTNGMENVCENQKLSGYHVNGGYAEYMTVPADFAFSIPQGFDAVHAAPLLCGGIIGLRALRQCGIKKGGRLGLFNFGLHAHIVIQIAIHEGVEVYVFTQKEMHKKHALDLGAKWAGAMNENDENGENDERPPELLDAGITFTSAGAVLPAALERMDKGATLVALGVTVEKIPALIHEKHLANEKKLCTVTNLTRKDAKELFELAARIPLRTDVETYSLDEAPEVLKRLKAGKVKGSAVLKLD
ncbi:MAG: zinc-dependent alcohol dehydrogenase family protein [Nitrospinota bacterium]